MPHTDPVAIAVNVSTIEHYYKENKIRGCVLLTFATKAMRVRRLSAELLHR